MKKMLLIVISSFILNACSTSSDSFQGQQNDGSNNEWSIPVSDVLDGGPGKDGIPSLTGPNLISASQTSVLNDNDFVLVFKNGSEVRAYPHIILDWHEIINDNIGDVSMAVTFCPLTGTGIGWSRIINNVETTFGVSGLLFNTNLIPFDRLTDSNWSQILQESVNGELLGQKIELYQLLETDWLTARTIYPDIRVVSTDTGFSRTYGTSPYGDYNTNNSRFLFPVEKDNRLPLKEKVLAIFEDGNAKVYRSSSFDSQNIITDTFNGKNYLIVGNTNFMFAYELSGELSGLEFNYIFGNQNNNSPDIVLEDNEGTIWNLFGEAVSGPRQGTKMSVSNAMMGQWFSIAAFYNTEIYSE